MEAPLQLSQENIKKHLERVVRFSNHRRAKEKDDNCLFFAHIFTFWQSDLFSFISQKFTLMDFTSEQNY